MTLRYVIASFISYVACLVPRQSLICGSKHPNLLNIIIDPQFFHNSLSKAGFVCHCTFTNASRPY